MLLCERSPFVPMNPQYAIVHPMPYSVVDLILHVADLF